MPLASTRRTSTRPPGTTPVDPMRSASFSNKSYAYSGRQCSTQLSIDLRKPAAPIAVTPSAAASHKN